MTSAEILGWVAMAWCALFSILGTRAAYREGYKMALRHVEGEHRRALLQTRTYPSAETIVRKLRGEL